MIRFRAPIADRCNQKSYPHLTDNRPAVRGTFVHIKATSLTKLRDALASLQREGRNWTMHDLMERFEQVDPKFEVES